MVYLVFKILKIEITIYIFLFKKEESFFHSILRIKIKKFNESKERVLAVFPKKEFEI